MSLFNKKLISLEKLLKIFSGPVTFSKQKGLQISFLQKNLQNKIRNIYFTEEKFYVMILSFQHPNQPKLL